MASCGWGTRVQVLGDEDMPTGAFVWSALAAPLDEPLDAGSAACTEREVLAQINADEDESEMVHLDKQVLYS